MESLRPYSKNAVGKDSGGSQDNKQRAINGSSRSAKLPEAQTWRLRDFQRGKWKRHSCKSYSEGGLTHGRTLTSLRRKNDF